METQPKKYGSFKDLDVYKAAREFRKKMCRVAKQLPESENYNLNVQMRRAALSLTNKYRHGRFHYLDNIRFVLISRGPLTELMDDLTACEDEQYLPIAQINDLNDEATSLMRQINGYVRYLRESKAGASLALREEPVRYSAGDEGAFLDELLD